MEIAHHTEIEVHLAGEPVGTGLVGVDLPREPADATFRPVKGVLEENGMIYMRDQKLTLEAQPFREKLFAHIIRPAMIFRHNWHVRDVGMWDNYQPQNMAIGDYALPLGRLMHRTAVINAVALAPV